MMPFQRKLVILGLLIPFVWATPARADITAFWGFSPSPTRSARGLALGINFVVVGFELEYANITEDAAVEAPSLRTGMINGLVQTPTKAQLYLTAGGGMYHEELGTATETNFGTNIGGGLKMPLIGPLRLRADYRIFRLRGSPIIATRQRLYVGANLSF